MASCLRWEDSKGAGTERAKRVVPSWGREYLDFCEQGETKSLVTRDRILPSPSSFNAPP